eukprot:1159341-Pelagomonas_calceolata.AAC.16
MAFEKRPKLNIHDTASHPAPAISTYSADRPVLKMMVLWVRGEREGKDCEAGGHADPPSTPFQI